VNNGGDAVLDRLESALRRYERIRPKPGDRPSRRNADEISDWLRGHVCPVVEQLLQRADFQKLARWPIDNLEDHASTPARKMVQAVDRKLIECATHLAKLIHRPILRRHLAPLFSRENPGGEKGKKAVARKASRSRTKAKNPPAQTAADFVATRPWRDLVCVYDYFGSVADLNLLDRDRWLGPNSEHAQVGVFLPYCKPQLHLPGDFISRSLMIRIQYWCDQLEHLSTLCEESLRTQRAARAECADIRKEILGVHESVPHLAAICLEGIQAGPHQACMTLVQTYAAYRPRADFSWLGPAGELAGNAARIRYFVDQRGDGAIADHIATALSEVVSLYRSEVPPDLLIAEKSRQFPLTLVDGRGRQELYWHGEVVEVDWNRHGRAWTLMVALAEKAKHRQGVDDLDELGISLKDARHDLKRLLPEELFDHIKIQKRVHRLDLPAEQLFVAQFDQLEHLTEVR
jgi:hypothetical protein